MTYRKTIIPAVAVALLLGASGIATHAALADNAKTADHTISATAASTLPSKAIPKLSQMGFDTMRAIRGARIAIFNGNVDMASKLVGTAEADVKLAEKDAGVLGPDGTFTVKAPGDVGSNKTADDRMVPIDGQIVLADSFVNTPEKADALKKANEHIAKGDHQKAAEVLKLAAVDVSFSRVMMPLAATQAHIQTAMDLLAKKQYYEANLALKAAEDGLRIDTVSLVDIAPKT